MKRTWIYWALAGEFLALVALVLLTGRYPALFSSLLAFPLEQLAACLQALAQRGPVGNGLAMALWLEIAFLPWLPICRHPHDRARRWEHLALGGLSLALLGALYVLMKPRLLAGMSAAVGMSAAAGMSALLPVMKAMLGGAVWSLLVLWLVLKLTRLFRSGDTRTLLGYLKKLGYALCMLFVGALSVSCCGALIAALGQVQQPADGAMAVLRFCASALPYTLDLAVTASAIRLFDRMLAEDPSGVSAAADRMTRLCCVSLGVSAAATALCNVVQLLLGRWLSLVETSVSIPVISLAFVAVALLGARLIAENRRLRDDNDLFI